MAIIFLGFDLISGTGEPSPCPASTFNNATGIMAEDDCQDCLQGQ